jgi:hypothetical protein
MLVYGHALINTQISKGHASFLQESQLTKLIRLRWATDVVDGRKKENLDPNRDKACHYRCNDLYYPIFPLAGS